MIDSQLDQASIEEEIIDDLADYEEYQQEQIIKKIINPQSESDEPGDHAHLQNIIKQKQAMKASQKPRLSEQQMKIKQMKLKDTRKYFQIIKTQYFLHLAGSLKETKHIRDQHQQLIATLTSGLNQNLCGQLFKLEYNSTSIKSLLLFVKQAFHYLQKQGMPMQPHHLFWSICQYIKLPCRKICFFDLQDLAQQSFYRLNYDEDKGKPKRANKKVKEHEMIRMQLHAKIQQQKLVQNKDYMFLEDYQFDQNSYKSSKNKEQQAKINKSRSSGQLNEYSMKPNSQISNRASSFQQEQLSQVDRKLRRQNNFIRNKNYKKCYFQVFCSQEWQWKTVNAQVLEIQDLKDIKRYVLNGKCIIGFSSMRILHCKDAQAQSEINRFNLQNICIQDLSMYFFDNLNSLTLRRSRVGLKKKMNQIFKISSLHKKFRYLLSSFESKVMDATDKTVLQHNLSHFPKTVQEMLSGDYFITKSLMPKYSILSPEAQAIEQKYEQEQVYLTSDLVQVSSKSVWIERNRKVKENEIPVKKTQNRNKNYTELYLLDQTEPFSIEVDEGTGQFKVDTQYKCLDIPPEYVPDERFVIVKGKLGGLLQKNKIINAKIVQGFQITMARIVPNFIGFIIYKSEEEQVRELIKQRREKDDKNKRQMKYEQLMGMWDELLKKMQITFLREQLYKKS